MKRPCHHVRAWVTDEAIVGSHNMQVVTCEQYIAALEAALEAVTLTPDNCADFKYHAVRAVRSSLGMEVEVPWIGRDTVQPADMTVA